MSRVALSNKAPINGRNWGGRPAAFLTLLIRIDSTSISSSVQSVSSVNKTSRWFSSIAIVGRLLRGKSSACRLPRPRLLMLGALPGHELRDHSRLLLSIFQRFRSSYCRRSSLYQFPDTLWLGALHECKSGLAWSGFVVTRFGSKQCAEQNWNKLFAFLCVTTRLPLPYRNVVRQRCIGKPKSLRK